MADYHARIVIRNTLVPFSFLRQKVDYSAVPWCTYLDPEVATVGLTESKAKKRGPEYDLIEQEMKAVDRAVLERAARWFCARPRQARERRNLGATIVGEHAGELIQEFVLAMKHGIGLKQIASTVYAYPTFASLVLKCAEKLNRKRLTPRARAITNWLYRRESLMSWLKKYWKWIAFGLAVVALLVSVSFLPIGQWVKSFSDWIRHLGWAGAFIFIAAYAGATVLFLPGAIFTIAAGLIARPT